MEGKIKSLVVYYSETGNTEKIAEAITMGLEADLKKIEEIKISDILNYDLLCVGTPVHGFAPAKIIREFLEKLPELKSKKAIAFCTMHFAGDKKTLKIIKKKFEARGAVFLGGFSCKGISRFIGNIGPKNFNKGHPKEEDIKKAKLFGANLLKELKNKE